MTVFYKTSKRIEVYWQAKKFPQETIGPKVNASKNIPKSPIVTRSLHTICEEADCPGPGCWAHVCISHGHVASSALSSRLRSRTQPAPRRAASPVTQTGMDICYRQWENESSCVWHFQTHFLMLLSGPNWEGQSKDECMKGKSTAEVEAELRAAGKSEDDIKSIGPHKEFKV